MTRTLASLTAALALAAILPGQTSGPYTIANPWWSAGQGTPLPASQDWDGATGQLRVLNQRGDYPTQDHPFFTALGTNGRACITCHQPDNAMSLSTALVQRRWDVTSGTDPVFAAVDGSNCPNLPQSQKSSHSLLLNRGLFRIALPWPPAGPDGQAISPEFQIEVASDPTGCNTSPIYGLNSDRPMISVYRRPRVVANFRYIDSPDGMPLLADGRAMTLQAQATGAALGHEEAASAPSADQLQQIVDFEMQVFSAQSWDLQGGVLEEYGGPVVLGADHLAQGGLAVPSILTDFDGWRGAAAAKLPARERDFRESAARGSDLFLTRQFQLDGGVAGTCSTCHQPGTPRWIDIGTTNLPTAKASPDLPVFKITCDPNAPPHPTLGSSFYTQDPGRALITGKCADAGSIVLQQFRGLAARAPYFVNGSAADLNELVDFYDKRFSIGFTAQEKQDLVNLLSIL